MRTVREVRPHMDGFLRVGRLEGHSDERPDAQAMTPKRAYPAAQAELRRVFEPSVRADDITKGNYPPQE